MYQMPTQPAPPVMPYVPVVSAPTAPALHMPATAAPAPRRASSNVALYVILGCLFLIALFLVVFFALRG
jgi:cobalamin biosynthesis Mg chelatase CobN